jgi:hypothetical protein
VSSLRETDAVVVGSTNPDKLTLVCTVHICALDGCEKIRQIFVASSDVLGISCAQKLW